MLISYTKMRTNGETQLILCDEYLNMSINLERLSKRISNPEYGICADGVLVLDHKHRPIPYVQSFSANGKQLQVTGDQIRMVGKYLLDLKDEPYIMINTNHHLFKTKKIGANVGIKYVLPSFHTEKTKYFKKHPHMTYYTDDQQCYIFSNQMISTQKCEFASHLLNDTKTKNCCFLQQSSNTLYLESFKHKLFVKPTDQNVCDVLCVLRNKNMLPSIKPIQIKTPKGILYASGDYDTIYIESKIDYISKGNYFY